MMSRLALVLAYLVLVAVLVAVWLLAIGAGVGSFTS